MYVHVHVCMYVSHLGMQLFRALRANVGIMCVDVTLRNVASLARGLHCIYVSLVILIGFKEKKYS